MPKKQNKTWDGRLSRILKTKSRFESRRSFVSKFSRLLIGMTGVMLPGKARLFAGPAIPLTPKQITTNWNWCGLHGYICGTGNCNGGTTGSGYQRAWNACCFDPATSCYKCCTYADRCSFTPPPAPFQCDGPTPSGPAWCGGAGNYYVCTVVTCATSGSATLAGCTCTAHPNC